MRDLGAALLLSALALAGLGSCVSDLSVGLVALENEDQGSDTADGGSADARGDAAGPDGTRDGGRADAAARRDASSPDAPFDARVEDAHVVDAGSSRDAACDDGRSCPADDGSLQDASRGDASSSGDARVSDAAGAACVPSDCDIVGVRLNEPALCDDGTPMQCVRNRNGFCDYACN